MTPLRRRLHGWVRRLRPPDAAYLRAGVAALAAAAWFGQVGPGIVEDMKKARIADTRVPSLPDLRGYAASHPDEVTLGVRAALAEAGAVQDREARWSRLVASLLSAGERRDGAKKARAMAPASPRSRMTEAEPDLAALASAILARQGYRPVELPPAPSQDVWPGMGRADRARAMRALLEDPGLDPEVAAIVLVATLDLLAAQSRRLELEAEIWTAMRDEEAAGFGER